MSRNSAIFLNGGAGRMISSIPALENFEKENPNDNFVIICEGGSDALKGHPSLYYRTYDNWHKGLFKELIKDRNCVNPEPYRVWEYYTQKCSLAQAYDIAINNKGIRKLQKPTIKLSKDELLYARKMLAEVKEKCKKDKIIVIQPFGRGVRKEDKDIVDITGRSIETKNLYNIVRKLSKKYAVIIMTETPLEFNKHMSSPVATPQNVHIRIWMGVIKQCDHFVGCDSVGAHMAYAFDTTTTSIIGSTFPINTSFPDYEKFDIIDLGKKDRVYSPIRITVDEFSDRINEGIMEMNDQQEQQVIASVNRMIKHGKNTR
jgi:ADP-heptose:LPS heptosyltransferase